MNREQKETIRKRLQEIEKRDGVLTAEACLKEARNPKSPLHLIPLEWDNEKAGHLYRLDQMRSFIVSLEISVSETTESRSAPVYVRDPRSAPNDQGYRALSSIRDDRAESMALINEEMKRIEALLIRVETIAEFIGMSDKVRPVVTDVRRLRNSFQLSGN